MGWEEDSRASDSLNRICPRVSCWKQEGSLGVVLNRSNHLV